MSASANHNSRSRAQSSSGAAGCAAPAANLSHPPDAAGAVIYLPDTVGAWLAIVAAHDRIEPREFLVRCICIRMEEIGLSNALDLLDAARAPP